MDKISVALTALLMLAMVVVIAPNIFAVNKGKILRNIALWLAIFSALALCYQNFGPDSPHPLFGLPDGIKMRTHSAPLAPTQAGDDKNDANHDGFTPPKD